MVGKIIWWVVSFGCAVLFYSIGVYASRLAKPMWFWSGVEVKDSEKDACKAILKEAMEKAVELSIPLTVDVTSGKNWLEQE